MKTRFDTNAEQAQKYCGEVAITAEKHRIHAEMKAYRKVRGLGTFKEISDATGGKVATNTIANMYTGTKVKNETWLQVGEALEKLRNQ